MQSLWKQKLERDVQVPNSVKTTWFDLCHDLQKVLEIEIPRRYFQEGNESDTQRRHVFIDKSLPMVPVNIWSRELNQH